MGLAVETPACPLTRDRDIHCPRNPSAHHSRIRGRLAPALSSRDIPSAPRRNTDIISSCLSSESHVRALPTSVVEQSVCSPPFPRNKSGKPLKSLLKLRRTHPRNSLSLITDPVDSSSSKSAPAALTHKGVRFHSQLEHVKLFVAKQKPLAVSREGHLTDTSGTDSEFPPYSYDGRGDDLKERPLVMHRIDVPTAPPRPDDTRDVTVENIDLSGTAVKGTVRVRNIAFEKCIAVRFTLDKWQTTSEVTARYMESIQNGTYDRFTFSIRLADILSRVEEKTLYLSVRYSVAGREIWDNNSGRNYQVRLVHEGALKDNTEARALVIERPEESSRPDDIADLRRRLEGLVELGCTSKTVGVVLAQESRRRCGSPSSAPSPPLRETTPRFKSETFPAGRYNVASPSHTPCPPAVHQTALSPERTLTSLRTQTQSCGRSFRHCASPVVTPSALAAEVSSVFTDSSDDPITPVPFLPSCDSTYSSSRNHTRGGTITFSHAPGVKRTPPTSPSAGIAHSALPLLPLSAPTSVLPQPQLHACFDLSTQSITRSSLSHPPSSSLSLSPTEASRSVITLAAVPDKEKESDSIIHHSDYDNVVNRYSIPFFLPSDIFGR